MDVPGKPFRRGAAPLARRPATALAAGFVLAAGLPCGASALAAQQGSPGKGEFHPFAGVLLPMEPSTGSAEPEFDVGSALLFGARFGYTLPLRLFIEGEFGYSPASLTRDGDERDLSILLYGARVGYAARAGERAEVLLSSGAGATSWSGNALESEVDFDLNFGLGIRYFVGPSVALRIDGRYHYMKDGFSYGRRQLTPGLTLEESRDPFNVLEASGGIAFVFGGVGDSDGDGVRDDRDVCPDTPTGTPVDGRGCPLDRDRDGVFDLDDRCPDTPRGVVVDERGCPSDEDEDGIPDGFDRCPETPAGVDVDEAGCPRDRDGDGVPDPRDRCPSTPFGTPVDERGCPPDGDDDGVPDAEDRCPDTPAGARVDEAGCPVAEGAERELLETGRLVVRNVYFETNSAALRPESRPALDEAGRILERNPQLRIEIQGHTDALGPAAYNQQLSQTRAEAVLDYLMDTFPELDRERFVTRGYGETRPIATNQTEEGRQQNRRVELLVVEGELPEER